MKKIFAIVTLALISFISVSAKEDRSNKNIWVEEVGPTEDKKQKWIYKIINSYDDNQRDRLIILNKDKFDKIINKISNGCNKNGFKYYYIFKEDNIYVLRAISGANVVRGICANNLNEIKGKIPSKAYDYFSSKTYNDNFKYFTFTANIFDNGIISSNAPKQDIEKFYAEIEEKKEDKIKAYDLQATLINKGLEIGNEYKFFFNDRNDDGFLDGNLRIRTATMIDESSDAYTNKLYYISWSPYSSNRIAFKIRSPEKIKGKFLVDIDWKNRSATIKKGGKEIYSAIMFKPKKLYTSKELEEIKPFEEPPKFAEPPKKKKPSDEKYVPAASGTGFFVSRKGHVITNYHVIEGCDQNKLSFDGKEIKADTLAIDKVNDLAILKASLRPKKVYPVATEDVTLLEDVIIAGYPLGKKVSSAIKTSKGSITALAGYKDNFSEFQTDAALNQGNSGGPIINQKGNVVGVAVANYGKKEGVESFNFGIKSSTLRTFASSNGLKFLSPNRRDLSNKDLGELITNGTVYLECYMTVAKIKRMIAEAENRKAFFSEYAN